MHVSSERGVMTVRRNVKRINLHFIPEIDLFSSFSPAAANSIVKWFGTDCWGDGVGVGVGVYGSIKSRQQQQPVAFHGN